MTHTKREYFLAELGVAALASVLAHIRMGNYALHDDAHRVGAGRIFAMA